MSHLHFKSGPTRSDMSEMYKMLRNTSQQIDKGLKVMMAQLREELFSNAMFTEIAELDGDKMQNLLMEMKTIIDADQLTEVRDIMEPKAILASNKDLNMNNENYSEEPNQYNDCNIEELSLPVLPEFEKETQEDTEDTLNEANQTRETTKNDVEYINNENESHQSMIFTVSPSTGSQISSDEMAEETDEAEMTFLLHPSPISSANEDDIHYHVQSLSDMLQTEHLANLTKRKYSFWHAVKNFHLAELNMNWSNVNPPLVYMISTTETSQGSKSAIEELAECLTTLCFKMETVILLQKVQKNISKYKQIDEIMQNLFKFYSSGEVCRRLIELWRVGTDAEEITSFLTWNSKEEWYSNNVWSCFKNDPRDSRKNVNWQLKINSDQSKRSRLPEQITNRTKRRSFRQTVYPRETKYQGRNYKFRSDSVIVTKRKSKESNAKCNYIHVNSLESKTQKTERNYRRTTRHIRTVHCQRKKNFSNDNYPNHSYSAMREIHCADMRRGARRFLK